MNNRGQFNYNKKNKKINISVLGSNFKLNSLSTSKIRFISTLYYKFILFLVDIRSLIFILMLRHVGFVCKTIYL